MLDVKIIAVGSVRDPNLRAMKEEYEKRLSPYAKLSVTEIKAEPFHDASRAPVAREREGERIIKVLERYHKDSVFLLAEDGKAYDSVGFSNLISKSEVVFVIGGAFGWSDGVRALPYRKLSLSPLTFPHELARVVLMEQIYRAATIGVGKLYHY